MKLLIIGALSILLLTSGCLENNGFASAAEQSQALESDPRNMTNEVQYCIDNNVFLANECWCFLGDQWECQNIECRKICAPNPLSEECDKCLEKRESLK